MAIATSRPTSRSVSPPVSRPVSRPPSFGSIAKMAVPITLANAATPALHIVDTAAVGRLDDPTPIAAVALAALVFNVVYWAFGFLRMGTTGLAAMAFGARERGECQAILVRALLVAALGGIALIALQGPIGWLAGLALDGSVGAESQALEYLAIRVWGAPGALAVFAISGWLIGIGCGGLVLVLHIALNVVNAGLDFFFVLGLGWGVEGVAAGTLIAETSAAAFGLFLVWRVRRGWPAPELKKRLVQGEGWRRAFAVNADIFLRTLCLVAAFAWFTNRAAGMGDVALAGTAILMHLIMLAAFLLDGFAFTAESFAGQAAGAKRADIVHQVVLRTGVMSLISAAVLSAAFFVGGSAFVRVVTVNEPAQALATAHLLWPALAPLTAVACFMLDGIFIGAAQSRAMRNTMIVSLAGFLLAERALAGFGLSGLWLSLHVFFILRGLTLGSRYPALLRKIRATAPAPAPA